MQGAMVAARPLRGAPRAAGTARAACSAAVRGFFAGDGFVEVDTPALQVSPGLEPHLQAFATDLHDPRDGRTAPRYLHTSPEFAMKKLLVGGMPRIWQLAHVFRDGERGATHHPEFSMLEWYRAGATYRDLMADCIGLLRACQAAAGAKALVWRGQHRRRPRGRGSGSASPRRSRSHAASTSWRPRPIRSSPISRCSPRRPRRIGIAPHPGDDWEALYFRIFLDRIEPHLGIGAPTILYDYPVSMAALSRRNPDDPRLAERFELYVCGLELANAFGELTDPAEQRARFLADQAKKQALYGETYPIDEDFLAALEHGLPRLRRHRARLRPPGHARAPAPPTSKTCCGRRCADILATLAADRYFAFLNPKRRIRAVTSPATAGCTRPTLAVGRRLRRQMRSWPKSRAFPASADDESMHRLVQKQDEEPAGPTRWDAMKTGHPTSYLLNARPYFANTSLKSATAARGPAG